MRPQPPEDTDNPVSQLALDRASRGKLIKDACAHFEELIRAFAGEKATICPEPMCHGVSVGHQTCPIITIPLMC